MNHPAKKPLTHPQGYRSGSRRLITILASFLVLAVLGAVLFSACSGSSSTSAPAATTTAGGFNKDAAGGSGQQGILPTSSPPINESGSRPSDIPVKIIRNASMDLEADNGEAAYQTLLKFATDRGGYEASRRLTTTTGYAVIEAKIKLAPQYLDEFLNYAGNTAKVINVSTTSQDVTESYYDAQTRLRTMEQMLAKYTDFLNQAVNVNEALSVQSEINRITAEIESLKGRLRYYDSMVAESTITLLIREAKDPVKITRDIRWNALTFADMGYLMQRGLLTVANILTQFIQWLLIALVSVSPLLIIALIAWLIIRKRRGPRPPRGAAPRSGSNGKPEAAGWTRNDGSSGRPAGNGKPEIPERPAGPELPAPQPPPEIPDISEKAPPQPEPEIPDRPDSPR